VTIVVVVGSSTDGVDMHGCKVWFSMVGGLVSNVRVCNEIQVSMIGECGWHGMEEGCWDCCDAEEQAGLPDTGLTLLRQEVGVPAPLCGRRQIHHHCEM
jgi:hypothetical protein